MQIEWIERNKLRINNRARNLYYLITKKKGTDKLIERCCDFKLLEQKCQEYMEKNGIREEEILYKKEIQVYNTYVTPNIKNKIFTKENKNAIIFIEYKQLFEVEIVLLHT